MPQTGALISLSRCRREPGPNGFIRKRRSPITEMPSQPARPRPAIAAADRPLTRLSPARLARLAPMQAAVRVMRAEGITPDRQTNNGPIAIQITNTDITGVKVASK